MRLGLIGTGKQGQRYLLEKNGGRHIKVSGSRRIPLDEVDGVIIATHPAGHKELALEAIAAGKAVLIEKPLALNLRDCMDIIDAAEKAKVQLEVAHTHLWNREWCGLESEAVCAISYDKHERDYSPWLDWAPHGLALLASAMPGANSQGLLHSLTVYKDIEHSPQIRLTWVNSMIGPYVYPDHLGSPIVPPMFLMLRDFCLGETSDYNFNRRVYRALFAEEYG
jgi:hypothetical protein